MTRWNQWGPAFLAGALLVLAGCARELKADFATQPASGYSGDALGVVVEVQDRDGKAVTDVPVAVTVSVVGEGATLEGTTTVTSSGGRAVFSDLRVVGSATGAVLEARAAEFEAAALSAAFDVKALKARFEQLEGAYLPGQPMAALRVQLVDGADQPVTTVQRTVKLALGTNPTAAVLGGTLERATTDGTAVFEGVTIDRPGEGLTLVASGAGFSQTSAAFTAAYSLAEREPADRAAAGAVLNDTAAAAEPLAMGVPFFGTLAPNGASVDLDHVRFTARAGDMLSVSAYANRLDEANWTGTVRLRLFAPDGQELYRAGTEELSWYAVDLGFKQVRLPASGSYVIALDADAYGTTVVGARYALVASLNASPAQLQLEQEPAGEGGVNDSIATAQPLQPGQLFGYYESLADSSAGAYDSDFYKVDVTAPTRMRLELVGHRNGAYIPGNPEVTDPYAWDTEIELQDAEGNVLWVNDDSYWYDSGIDYLATAAGTYYVRVTRCCGDSASPYLLNYRAEAVAARDAVTPNGTAEQAMALSYGDYVAGSITNPAVPAFFKVSGKAGELVRVRSFDQSSWMGSSVDVNVALLDVGTSSELSAALGGRYELARTILQKDGDFLIRVTGAVGNFVLHVERFAAGRYEAEANDPDFTTRTASTFDAGGWAAGALSADGDEDAYRLQAQAGQLVSVSLFGNSGSNDGEYSFSSWGSSIIPTLQVYDASGTLLSSTTYDRTDEPDHAESLLRSLPMLEVSFRAPVAGDFYVVVSDSTGTGSETAFYALQLWKNQ